MRHLVFLLVLFFLPAGAFAAPADWNARMQELRAVLSQLLPDIFDDQRFNSPENFERIASNVKKLSNLSHEIPYKGTGKMSEVRDLDPSIGFISGLLEEQSLLALSHYRGGRTAYAQSLLKTIPSFCIACHTRSTGLDLSSLKTEIPQDLPPLERPEFYSAIREFDLALDETEKILADPKLAREGPMQWTNTARAGLATAVRVKRNPDRALKLVEQVLATPDAPLFLIEDATVWKSSLQEWKQATEAGRESQQDLLAQARSLIDRAEELQEYPADRNADILYLRASATLHDFLTRYPDHPKAGEALLLLGLSYEALQDMQLWSLHDLYYEACIHKFPHTEIANSCYSRYEQSIYFGYTGSGGTHIPADVRKHLDELKKLARPKARP